jgi:hypothetical protein
LWRGGLLGMGWYLRVVERVVLQKWRHEIIISVD